jgi:hypothetical protein
MLCQSIANKRAEMLEPVVVVLIALEPVIFIK